MINRKDVKLRIKEIADDAKYFMLKLKFEIGVLTFGGNMIALFNNSIAFICISIFTSLV